MRISKQVICIMPTGTPVYSFRLTNSAGSYVELTNWGARWLSAIVPDARGRMSDILLKPVRLLTDEFYMGATVGRVANRIGHARLVLDRKIYELEKNDGENTNHGGFSGFHQKLWDWEILPDGIRFTLHSADGEGGWPGNVEIAVEYLWNNDNELTIRHTGTTDRPTWLNLTNHAYFNLSGDGRKVTEHVLYIPARTILDTTPQFIPTGRQVDVSGTPFDFTCPKRIGQDLYADNDQLRWNKGYNHCYILKKKRSDTMVEAARLYEPTTGRTLTVSTDLPSVLLYTAGYYTHPDTAVCLETQYWPDTPSHPDFPSCLLRTGETYRQTTVFRFTPSSVPCTP